MILSTRQVLLAVLLSAAAADDTAAHHPIRKRTQQRHSSSVSSAHLRRGRQSDTNFDPYIGVSRELKSDEQIMSHSMSMSMSVPATTPEPPTQALTESMSVPATTPEPPTQSLIEPLAADDLENNPCGDPNLVPLEVNIKTDSFAKEDKTGYRLMFVPQDGSEPETFFERIDDMEKDTTYDDAHCVPKGKYIFTVYDDQGGLGGLVKGEYSVKIKGTEILYGSSFPPKSISYTILAGVEPNMSEEDKQWLDGHNERRKMFHEDNGKTFKPLVWSESLAQAALEHASRIVPTCEKVPKTDTWGHNAAISPRKVRDQDQILPENVLRYMFDRRLTWQYPETNQLSQIAWRGSRYVGCASLIELSDNGLYCHVSVCKYGRPGNCSTDADNWLEKTLADRSSCGQVCPNEGCA